MKINPFSRVLIIITLSVLWSCNNTTEPNNNNLTFTVEDASCIEAWLSFKRNGITGEVKISLYRNDTLTLQFNLPENDTIYVDEGLLPNTIYNYEAVFTQGNITIAKLKTTAQTMDTTSSNFTWETFEFGQHSSSVLYDVAIIDDNNIWAVGEIYMNDSLGNPDPHAYNAVHWDGNEWKFIRLRFNCRLYFPNCGPDTMLLSRGYSIFARDANDIWISAGSVHHFNGTNWTQEAGIVGSGSANKIWGNSNELWFVGNNGFIAHRSNNGSWRKIESGTDLNLLDINGNKNGEIYSCGGNYSTGQGIVLKINNNNAVTKIIDSYYYGTGFDSAKMFTENLYGPLTSTWVNSEGTLFTVGNLIYRYNLGIWGYASGIESNDLNSGPFSGRGFLLGIRGKENNDFIFVGQRNTIRHFNGINAIQLGEPFSYTSDYSWLGVEYKQNTAVAAGRKGGYGAVMVFKK